MELRHTRHGRHAVPVTSFSSDNVATSVALADACAHHRYSVFYRQVYSNVFVFVPYRRPPIVSTQILTSCMRAAGTICPRPSPTPWAPNRLVPPSRRQRSSSFPRPTRPHHCSRLTLQHGVEQSSLVTLTFDLLTLKVESESRVTWATSVPILVFLVLSVLDLGPMYATDRRQTASSPNAPAC